MSAIAVTTTRTPQPQLTVKRKLASGARPLPKRANVRQPRELAAKSRRTNGSNIFRWYRSGWGRYSQVDPILRKFATGTLHPFAYGDGSPTEMTDPYGLVSVSWFQRKLERYPKRTQLPPVCKGQLSCTDLGRDFDKDSWLKCACVGCSSGWRPVFAARLSYDMYLATEQPFPDDPDHEFHEREHIQDINSDVVQWLQSLEAQTFPRATCEALCKSTVGLFKQKVAEFANASQTKRH